MTALVKLWKIFLISLQKLFSFSRKSNFAILDFQISWHHQMQKHKKKKYILLNNLRGKLGLLMKLGQFMPYSKGNNFIKKLYKNCGLKISLRLFCVFKKLSNNLSWKMKFLKKSTYIRYVIAKLSKLVQISMLASSYSFLQRFFWKFKKGRGTSFQASFLQDSL